MGRGLDLLRGRVTVNAQTAAPMARAIVGANGSARLIDATGMGGGIHVPNASDPSKSTAAYRCLSTTASNLASVDMVIMQGDEATRDHEVARMWNEGFASSPLSARVVREVAFSMAEVRGEAFVYLDRGPTGVGPVRGAWPIYDEVDVLVAGDPENPHSQELRGFRVRRGNKAHGLLPSEVLWLRYPHPTRAWHALAPWAAAMGAAELDSHARAWQLGEFKNGAKPGGVVHVGEVDEPMYNRLMADFRTGIEGPQNAGRFLLTAGPTQSTVSRLTLTTEEMGYIGSRKANAEEIMLALGYSPDYFLGDSTFENRRAAKTSAWSDLYVPKLDVLGSEVDHQLLPDPGVTAAFDVSQVDALQENQDSIYNRIRGIAYTDTLTVDESRAQLGMEPLPGGRGSVTLTEFRSRVKVEETAAVASLTTAAEAGIRGAELQRQAAQLSVTHRAAAALPRRVVLVAHRGNVTPTVIRKKGKRKVKRPSTDAFLQTHERVGERVFSALADKQLRVVLRALSKARTSHLQEWVTRGPAQHELDQPCTCTRIAADDLFDAAYWRGQTEEATAAWLAGVWETAGSQIADGVGVGFDLFDQQIIDALDARRVALAEQVTQTTRHVIDSRLLAVVAEEGWSIADAERALRSVFEDLSGWRAQTIARTEVVGGYNGASTIAARESGVVGRKEWLTAHDERVRKSHQRLDGVSVPVDERFSNGLDHPGDPAGDPSETVNCRCTLLYLLD